MSKNQEAIDNVFLFLLTSLTLWFGFLNDAIIGSQAILFQVPLVISGLFYPFYVGYVRGVVAPRSSMERVRGWVFFSFGVTTYGFIFVWLLFNDFLKRPELKWISLIVAVLGYLLSWRLVAWATKVIGIITSKATEKKITESCLAAMFLSATVSLSWYFFYHSWTVHSIVGYDFVWAALMFLVPFAILENSERLLKR